MVGWTRTSSSLFNCNAKLATTIWSRASPPQAIPPAVTWSSLTSTARIGAFVLKSRRRSVASAVQSRRSGMVSTIARTFCRLTLSQHSLRPRIRTVRTVGSTAGQQGRPRHGVRSRHRSGRITDPVGLAHVVARCTLERARFPSDRAGKRASHSVRVRYAPSALLTQVGMTTVT